MKARALVLFVMGGFSFWIVNAALDFLASPGSQFLDWLIFKVPIHELYIRSTATLAFALAGIAAFWNSSVQALTLKELREANARYRSLLDNLPVGVYRTTPGGEILDANQKLAELLGYENAGDLGKVNFGETYVDKAERISHLQKLRESSVFAEFELRRKDGGTVWVRDYPKAILNTEGNIAYIDGVFVETHGIDAIMREITEHRRLESMKDHFISAVTHELRTPLVSIKGYVDYILVKASKSVPDNIKSIIEIVRRNTDRLLALTNDLLNVQRMESGGLEFKPQSISIRELVTQCLEEIQPILEQKGQKIHSELPAGPLMVDGDRLRLGQILTNLLTNASKFTPDDGDIKVRVEEDEGTLSVYVTDTGIGIDKKDLERVFEPFAAIEKPTYFKGTGLGLSLTKKLVEAHGAKIWASSPGKGQGATFAFALPKRKEELVRVLG